jgi:hypothetical protein
MPLRFHLTAFDVLLFRWLSVEEVCISFANSYHQDKGMWTGINPYLRMLPPHIKPPPSQSFAYAIVNPQEKSHRALSNAISLEVITTSSGIYKFRGDEH